MEYVIAFNSTNLAIKSEQCLIKEQTNVSVMPLPSQIRAGCGICLRINESDIKTALCILQKNKITEIELFSKVFNNDKFEYIKIERGDID